MIMKSLMKVFGLLAIIGLTEGTVQGQSAKSQPKSKSLLTPQSAKFQKQAQTLNANEAFQKVKEILGPISPMHNADSFGITHGKMSQNPNRLNDMTIYKNDGSKIQIKTGNKWFGQEQNMRQIVPDEIVQNKMNILDRDGKPVGHIEKVDPNFWKHFDKDNNLVFSTHKLENGGNSFYWKEGTDGKVALMKITDRDGNVHYSDIKYNSMDQAKMVDIKSSDIFASKRSESKVNTDLASRQRSSSVNADDVASKGNDLQNQNYKNTGLSYNSVLALSATLGLSMGAVALLLNKSMDVKDKIQAEENAKSAAEAWKPDASEVEADTTNLKTPSIPNIFSGSNAGSNEQLSSGMPPTIKLMA